jgi:DNA-binding CsgD family transcriptional regulator
VHRCRDLQLLGSAVKPATTISGKEEKYKVVETGDNPCFTGDHAARAGPRRRNAWQRAGRQWAVTGPRTATRAHPKQLTRRESEVLGLIRAGYTNAAISAELFISAKTVDHHVSAILAKLGAPNRNAAAAQAVRLGLVDGAGAAETAG